MKERFFAEIETWENERAADADTQIVKLKAELEAVNARIERINTGFADGALNIDEFREMKNPLVPKKAELEANIGALSKRRTNRLEPLRNWICEANTVGNLISQENWGEMKKLLQKVGSNRFLRAQTLTVSFVKPWESLAKTNVCGARHRRRFRTMFIVAERSGVEVSRGSHERRQA